MKVCRKDDLGDRMKAYEAAGDVRLDGLLPIYARIDGRGFSRFTRGMKRPFDPSMTAAMVETVKGLVEKTHARIGYTQSDEISLVWLADEGSQVFFDGRAQKLTSVLSGLATALFNRAILADPELAGYADRLPHFDCRVVQLPSREEAANMLLWRELDATKNAIQSAAYAEFSHKALHGKSTKEMRAMMAERGVDFDAFPVAFRRGTFVRRVTEARTLSATEIERIPEGRRPAPNATFLRSDVRVVEMPPLLTVSNRADVLLDAAQTNPHTPQPGP